MFSLVRDTERIWRFCKGCGVCRSSESIESDGGLALHATMVQGPQMSGESQRLQRLLEQPLKAGLARTTTAREAGGYCSKDRAANISKTVLQDILSFSLLLTFGLTFYRQP